MYPLPPKKSIQPFNFGHTHTHTFGFSVGLIHVSKHAVQRRRGINEHFAKVPEVTLQCYVTADPFVQKHEDLGNPSQTTSHYTSFFQQNTILFCYVLLGCFQAFTWPSAIVGWIL